LSEQWEITEHCCRVCQGRVVRREAGLHPATNERIVVVMCSVCELKAEGIRVNHRDICCCGASRKTYNAKLRCRRQENPTPAFPAAIVAEEVK
jgi:hypothetical protein